MQEGIKKENNSIVEIEFSAVKEKHAKFSHAKFFKGRHRRVICFTTN